MREGDKDMLYDALSAIRDVPWDRRVWGICGMVDEIISKNPDHTDADRERMYDLLGKLFRGMGYDGEYPLGMWEFRATPENQFWDPETEQGRLRELLLDELFDYLEAV